MARRGRTEGSIYRRRDDPRCADKSKDHAKSCRCSWVAQIPAGLTENGKRKYRRAVRRTRAEAAAELRKMQDAAKAGVKEDRRLTVTRYADEWLDEVLRVDRRARPTTVENYRKILRLYVLPHVGSVRLTALTQQDVRRMLVALDSKGARVKGGGGLSDRTQAQALAVLRHMLTAAENDGRVLTNVARKVKGPSITNRKTDDVLDAAGARAVLAAAADHRLGALAVLALKLGLRKGELLALRWENITGLDGTAPTLTVAGTLKRRTAPKADEATPHRRHSWQGDTAHTLYVDPPKTSAGLRTLPLKNGTAAALRTRRARQREERMAAGPLWRDVDPGTRGYIFTTARGGPLDPVEATRLWHGWTEAAGLGKVRFHASRHTAATLLLEDGVPLHLVSAVLGHANLSITADVYGHVTADALRAALPDDEAGAGV